MLLCSFSACSRRVTFLTLPTRLTGLISHLLDIVGFTATNKSFIIGQAFLTHEEEGDYIWVSQWIRDIYEQYDLLSPESITSLRQTKLVDSIMLVAWSGQRSPISFVVGILIRRSVDIARNIGFK
jgi:hypothetical protein